MRCKKRERLAICLFCLTAAGLLAIAIINIAVSVPLPKSNSGWTCCIINITFGSDINLDEEKADQLYKKIVSMPASYSPFSIMRGWWIFRKQSETILPGDINDFLWPGKYGYSMEVPLRDHLIVRFFNRKTGESFSYIHSDTTAALVFHGRWEKPILAPGCTHEKFLIDLLGVDIARQWRMNNR